MAASAPAGRVAPSHIGRHAFPSGENAGASTYPFNSVRRRAGLPCQRADKDRSALPAGRNLRRRPAPVAFGDHAIWPSRQCCSAFAAAVTRSLLVRSPRGATRISIAFPGGPSTPTACRPAKWPPGPGSARD